MLTRNRLDTINSLPPNLIYKSASETAKALVPSLRAQGADIIIALTHAREPSDVKLAEKTPTGLIDIVLGGHDHFYGHQIINGTHVLRSGTDFKQLSYIEAWRQPPSAVGSTIASEALNQEGNRWLFEIIRRDVTRSIPEDATTMDLVASLTSNLKQKLEKPIGYTSVPLDARFTTVRTRESNLGNFVCDLMRYYYSTDCALMAGGTIRGDQVYPPGVLRLKDIMNCFPFEDPVIVVKVKGKAIRDALENSVSLVPALEGRYTQVSGMQYCYDVQQPPGKRLKWVKIREEMLDDEQTYSVATRGYMGRGKDGFKSLLVQSEGGEAEEVVSEENGILISMILRQYFMSLKVLGRWVRWSPSMSRHWGGVHDKLHSGKGMEVNGGKAHKHTRSGNLKGEKVEVEGHKVDSDSEDEASGGNGSEVDRVVKRGAANERRTSLARRSMRQWMKVAGIVHYGDGLVEQQDDEQLLPHWTRGIAPRLEGRIVIEGSDANGTVR